MPSLRNQQVCKELTARLLALQATAKPKWGRLDAPRMVCHLGDALAVALGELPTKSMHRKVFQRFPVKHLAIYVVPWPKGAPSAPEQLATAPGDFDADRQRVIERMERLAAAACAPGPAHPLFGPLDNEAWNFLQARHIAHHLKQFGS
jgi:hypothetical protein